MEKSARDSRVPEWWRKQEWTKKAGDLHHIAMIIVRQAVDNEGRSIDARCSILLYRRSPLNRLVVGFCNLLRRNTLLFGERMSMTSNRFKGENIILEKPPERLTSQLDLFRLPAGRCQIFWLQHFRSLNFPPRLRAFPGKVTVWWVCVFCENSRYTDKHTSEDLAFSLSELASETGDFAWKI